MPKRILKSNKIHSKRQTSDPQDDRMKLTIIFILVTVVFFMLGFNFRKSQETPIKWFPGEDNNLVLQVNKDITLGFYTGLNHDTILDYVSWRYGGKSAYSGNLSILNEQLIVGGHVVKDGKYYSITCNGEYLEHFKPPVWLK